MDWNLAQQQLDKYVTDSDNESDEEGDLEVVYGRTCMTSSGRSVEGIPHTHPIPQVIRLELCLESG